MTTTLTPTRQLARTMRWRLVAVAVGLLIVVPAGFVLAAGRGPSVRVEQGASGSSGRFAVDVTRAYTAWDWDRFVALTNPSLPKAARAARVQALLVTAETDGVTPPALVGATYELVASSLDADRHVELVRVVAGGLVDTWRWTLTSVNGRWSVVDWDKNP